MKLALLMPDDARYLLRILDRMELSALEGKPIMIYRKGWCRFCFGMSLSVSLKEQGFGKLERDM
ncbi:Uncharacterised protein [Klebsiella pneumoniae]|nr:Uncharacterised protein [Klebsiella pneumoniae]